MAPAATGNDDHGRGDHNPRPNDAGAGAAVTTPPIGRSVMRPAWHAVYLLDDGQVLQRGNEAGIADRCGTGGCA